MILRAQQSACMRKKRRSSKVDTDEITFSTMFRIELRANFCIGTTGEILHGVKSNRVLCEVTLYQGWVHQSGCKPLVFCRYDGIRSRSSKLEISLVRLRRGVRPPLSPRIYFAHPNVSAPLSSTKLFRTCFKNLRIARRELPRLHIWSLCDFRELERERILKIESSTVSSFTYVFKNMGDFLKFKLCIAWEMGEIRNSYSFNTLKISFQISPIILKMHITLLEKISFRFTFFLLSLYRNVC